MTRNFNYSWVIPFWTILPDDIFSLHVNFIHEQFLNHLQPWVSYWCLRFTDLLKILILWEDVESELIELWTCQTELVKLLSRRTNEHGKLQTRQILTLPNLTQPTPFDEFVV